MKQDVCEWLRNFLKDGPKEVSDIRMAARDAGYTGGELREAKHLCFVVVTNSWHPGDHCTSQWFWSLPEDMA